MTEVKRLHISGLNPTQCSVQDLHSRFQSFQLQVRDVHNWPPGRDGVGNAQNWCFLTVVGEASKIKRATEILNNTTWKGTKLRIGAAKKEAWTEKERVEVEEIEPEKKKKKRKSRGVESETINQPITEKVVTEGEWVSYLRRCFSVSIIPGEKRTDDCCICRAGGRHRLAIYCDLCI
jgi:hypothetical protein